MAATSVSWETLRELAGFRSRAGCAVSCFVDLDPHDTPTPADVRVRMHASIDEAGKQAEANRHLRTHEQLVSIRDDLQRIEDYFDREFSRATASVAWRSSRPPATTSGVHCLSRGLCRTR